MPQNLPQPSILITGSASGLGQATAKLFHALNWDVVLFDKAQGDVTDEHAVKKVIDGIKNPRACVNCAGIFSPQKIVSKKGVMSLDDFRRTMDINVMGTFNVMRFFVEKIASLGGEGERGIIINTSSIAAFEGQVGQIVYSASKAAIEGMTLPAARELAQYGIRVMTISPGAMDTPIMANVNEEFRQKLMSDVVFPKRLGKPEEFAQCVKHIIENQYLNGSVIRLDGGLRMQ